MNEHDGDDEEPYRRGRVPRLLTRLVATVLVIAIILAFPLGYLLDAQLQNHRVEAVVAITEIVVVAVLLVVAGLARGRPR